MGRGRAKAKQTKVARQLKYGGPSTDLERLQAELAGTGLTEAEAEDDEASFEDDPYAKYIEEDFLETDDGESESREDRD